MENSAYETHVTCWQEGQAGVVCGTDLAAMDAASLSWIHVTVRDRNASAELLSGRLGFHELEVEDALKEGERPHLQEDDDHLFLTAPSIRFEGEKLYFVEVAFRLEAGRLVTVASESVAQIDRWVERFGKNRAKSNHITASRLMYVLLDDLVDAYYPAMEMLEDQAEDMESLVFEGTSVPIKDLLRVKRRLLEIRRRLGPVRDILNGLLRHDIDFIAAEDRAYYQDVYDHILRVLEHVDLNRDILAAVLDANLATVSNRLNQIMRVMTVLATVLMSVTLVASIYGMNFRLMPETQFAWGYPAALVAMALIAVFELWLFRRKGWL